MVNVLKKLMLMIFNAYLLGIQNFSIYEQSFQDKIGGTFWENLMLLNPMMDEISTNNIK